MSEEKRESSSETKPGRLTRAEKKRNHIDSERRRRNAIRAAMEELATLIDIPGQGKSEKLVLDTTLKTLREQIAERQAIIAEKKAKGEATSHLELPKRILEGCKKLDERDKKEKEKEEREEAEQAEREGEDGDMDNGHSMLEPPKKRMRAQLPVEVSQGQETTYHTP
jgi:hypothetical protein